MDSDGAAGMSRENGLPLFTHTLMYGLFHSLCIALPAYQIVRGPRSLVFSFTLRATALPPHVQLHTCILVRSLIQDCQDFKTSLAYSLLIHVRLQAAFSQTRHDMPVLSPHLSSPMHLPLLRSPLQTHCLAVPPLSNHVRNLLSS